MLMPSILSVALEQDVLPHIGNSSVPDDLIQRLGKYIQIASRLYSLDLQQTPSRRTSSASESISALSDRPSIAKESRFDSDFDRQSKGKMYGTTVDIVEVSRERFAYWCFDLLFVMCSDCEDGEPNCFGLSSC